MYMYIYTYVYIYICICICMYVSWQVSGTGFELDGASQTRIKLAYSCDLHEGEKFSRVRFFFAFWLLIFWRAQTCIKLACSCDVYLR